MLIWAQQRVDIGTRPYRWKLWFLSVLEVHSRMLLFYHKHHLLQIFSVRSVSLEEELTLKLFWMPRWVSSLSWIKIFSNPFMLDKNMCIIDEWKLHSGPSETISCLLNTVCVWCVCARTHVYTKKKKKNMNQVLSINREEITCFVISDENVYACVWGTECVPCPAPQLGGARQACA